MKTQNTTSARSILSSASGEDLLLLAIMSGRSGRTDIERVLEQRAAGAVRSGRSAKPGKRRAA